MDLGYEVFAPIPHSHPIETLGHREHRSPDFWLKQDYAILNHCDALVVYCMEGWDSSKGIAAEIYYALEHGKPVIYLGENMFQYLPGIIADEMQDDYSDMLDLEDAAGDAVVNAILEAQQEAA